MLREDIYCNNTECSEYNKCYRSAYAIPIDGKVVILVNLADTEFCKKNEIS